MRSAPLTFEEFEATVHQAVYMSATPGPYELERSKGHIVQQLIRPTGIVDPQITVRPTEGQIDDLLEEIRGRVERGERSLSGLQPTSDLAIHRAIHDARPEIGAVAHAHQRAVSRPKIKPTASATPTASSGLS